MENEVTVLIECGYEELHNILKKYKFNIVDKYTINDIYMIPVDIDIYKLHNLEILSKCVIIRDIPNIEKILLYKLKKYASNGDILFQKKIECPIIDINKAIDFMCAIKYEKIFTIFDECIVYSNNIIEFTVQIVNNKYIFIEMEQNGMYFNKNYCSVQDLKNELEKYNLPYDKKNYFVKKAEIMLNEIKEKK